MKLKKMKLRNFRCYEEEIIVDLGDLVVLVGKNDAGKSSLLDALNIFFDERSAPDREDKCVRSEDHEIHITCVFGHLPSNIVIDAQHSTDLASEYLLNSDHYLEITKSYSCDLAKPKLKRQFISAWHPETENYNDLHSLTNANLKKRAKSLDVDLDEVNQTINSALRQAIWAHNADLQSADTEINLKGDAETIWIQLKKSLPVYALFKSDRPSTDQDAEAQDPMKAAVKEAIKAQQQQLELVTKGVEKEVQTIANATVAKIREMDPELANQLTPRVSHKNWDTLFSVNLAGDEDIPINKRGSGTRRLVLLNFFRAKAEEEAISNSTGVIYAIEEPETSQHPHNQVMLIKALEDLAERPDCQVFLSTHTPVFARRFKQDALRLVTKQGKKPVIFNGNEDSTIEQIVKSLGVLPDHGVKVFFGVEGKHDISFLQHVSKMLRENDKNFVDLAEEELAGRLVFVPLGGSNIELWVSRLQEFKRPEYYLMDRDNPPPGLPKYGAFAKEISPRKNCTAWTTSKRELENYIHPDVIKGEYCNYSGTGCDFEDVPELVAKAVHEASDSQSPWQEVTKDTAKLGKKVSRAKHRLNNEMVRKMTPCLLSEIDTRNELRDWLKVISSSLQEESD